VDLEDFYEEVARTASQELLYNDILRALKDNTQGDKISELLRVALTEKNLCLASVLAQFLLKDPLSKIVLLYLRLVSEGRRDALRWISRIASEEDSYQAIREIPTTLKTGGEDSVSEVIEGCIKELEDREPYRYLFPTYILHELLGTISELAEEDFSEGVSAHIASSVATCSNLGVATREAMLGNSEHVEGALVGAYMSLLTHLAFSKSLSPDYRERAIRELAEGVSDYGDMVGEVVATTLSIDTIDADRETWDRLLAPFGTEVKAMILTSSKANNPELKVPLTGYEREWEISAESVVPMLSDQPEFSSLSSKKVIKDLFAYELEEEDLAYLIPYWIPFSRREELLGVFSSLNLELQSSILKTALSSSFPEDRETIERSVGFIISSLDAELQDKLKDMI